MDIERALSGVAGQPGVRALLLGDGRSALQDALQSMAGPGRELRSLRLRRAKFKPGRKLTALYDVSLAGMPRPAPIGVTWSAGGVPANETQLTAAQQELPDGGTFTGFDRLWATEPSMGMVVLAAPLDPAFPSLGRLSDPRNVSATLALTGTADGHQPDRYMVRPIRYRPGKRHVLEYRGPAGRRIFAKLYRRGTAEQVAEAVTSFAEVLEGAGVLGASSVRPAAILADAQAILFQELGGTPLTQGLGAGRDLERGQLHDVGRLIRAVHSVGPDPAWGFRQRHLDDEVGATLRACEAMIGLKPNLGEIAVGVVEGSRAGLEALEQEAPTVVHGDLKADHLLCGPGGIAVLDTDRSGLADPALDIGKLLADLRWWSWVSAGPNGAAAEAELLAGYGPAPGRVARAELYAALLLVKMAARRTSVASRDWEARTESVLALASHALNAPAVR